MSLSKVLLLVVITDGSVPIVSSYAFSGWRYAESVKREDEKMAFTSSTTSEYVSEELTVKGSGFEQFAEVFARFQLQPEETSCVAFFNPYIHSH